MQSAQTKKEPKSWLGAEIVSDDLLLVYLSGM